MDEVVLALEGAVAPMSCFVDDPRTAACCARTSTTTGTRCATKLLWTRVQGGVIKALAHTTLAELVAFSERSQLSSPADGDRRRLTLTTTRKAHG